MQMQEGRLESIGGHAHESDGISCFLNAGRWVLEGKQHHSSGNRRLEEEIAMVAEIRHREQSFSSFICEAFSLGGWRLATNAIWGPVCFVLSAFGFFPFAWSRV